MPQTWRPYGRGAIHLFEGKIPLKESAERGDFDGHCSIKIVSGNPGNGFLTRSRNGFNLTPGPGILTEYVKSAGDILPVLLTAPRKGTVKIG